MAICCAPRNWCCVTRPTRVWTWFVNICTVDFVGSAKGRSRSCLFLSMNCLVDLACVVAVAPPRPRRLVRARATPFYILRRAIMSRTAITEWLNMWGWSRARRLIEVVDPLSARVTAASAPTRCCKMRRIQKWNISRCNLKAVQNYMCRRCVWTWCRNMLEPARPSRR